MRQLKNISSHMDEHRKTISAISNQNQVLRNNEENVSREIRGMYVHSRKVLFLSLLSLFVVRNIKVIKITVV